MTIRRISEAEILQLGLTTIGFDILRQQKTRHATNIKRFRASFGPLPITASQLFCEIQDEALGETRIKKPNSDYLLMTLMWLNLYRTESELAGLFKIDEKTVRKWIWSYSLAIQALKQKMIVWKWDNEQPISENIFILSVDGTHCRIQEPRNAPSSQWYSHKFKGPGLSYEIAIDIVESKIAWIHGPFPAGKPDISIYRKEAVGLQTKIPAGKKVIADRGYQGNDNELCTPNPFDSIEVKKFKARARARHETINMKLKDFKILETRFRHTVTKHIYVFEAVAVLVQMDMNNGMKMFEI